MKSRETTTQIINVEHNITEVVEERRLRWFGYLKRIKSDRIPKMLLREDRQGSGRKSKQRKEWMDGVIRITNKYLREKDAEGRKL